MSGEALVFWVLALLVLGSAAAVVLSRSLIYSAFALLGTFFGVAGFYLLLGADFLAASQLLIYVGGILMLLLFGVMLTHKLYDLDLKTEIVQFGPGVIIAAGMFVILSRLALVAEWRIGEGRAPAPTTEAIGLAFMGDWILPFEAASVLLLVALIGAAMIVRRSREA